MIPFAKVQSIGNDFVLLDLDALGPGLDLPALAVAMCDRKFGIGSDGLLTVAVEDGALAMRMFNPDGTEDFCGNGMRCGAWYAHSRGRIGKSFDIHHGGKIVPTYVASDGSVCTTLGSASFEPADVPISSSEPWMQKPLEVGGESVSITAVTTGSTHTVIFVEQPPTEESFLRVSSALEHHPLFPARTSVIWAQPKSSHELDIRIWERGVGETLGCGTGSAAAVAAMAARSGDTGLFKVNNRGGSLAVRLEVPGGLLHVKSSATVVYEGQYAEGFV